MPSISGVPPSRQFHQHSNSNGAIKKTEKPNISPKAAQSSKFEADMEQHGLQKNIKEIQILNTYIQSEIGKNNTNIRCQIPSVTAGSTVDDGKKSKDPLIRKSEIKKITKEVMKEPITFPYQRRARSFSPPKNEPSPKIFQAHSPKTKEDGQKLKPVVARGFVCGKKLVNSSGIKRGHSPPSTEEETKSKVKNLTALRENICSKNKNYNLEDDQIPQVKEKNEPIHAIPKSIIKPVKKPSAPQIKTTNTSPKSANPPKEIKKGKPHDLQEKKVLSKGKDAK